MLGYIRLKDQNEELYESEFWSKTKEKHKVFSKILYCYYELVVKIKYFFNIITVKQIYDAYLFIFPFEIEKESKIKKCMKKMHKLMKKYNINTLMLSQTLQKYMEKELISQKIHILDGKGLMPYLIKEIVEYILEKQNKKTELEDLYLCIKENKSIYIDNIAYLLPYFKTINIITPNINAFQKLANKIEDEGNIIVVSNNKKKSLKKANVIVNFDFEEAEIKKYTIYRRAIIINVKEKAFYENSGFDGIQIQQIGINTSSEIKELLNKYHLLQDSNLTTLYESLIWEKHGFAKVKQKMNQDQVKVVKLYGKKGEIGEKEYLSVL